VPAAGQTCGWRRLWFGLWLYSSALTLSLWRVAALLNGDVLRNGRRLAGMRLACAGERREQPVCLRIRMSSCAAILYQRRYLYGFLERGGEKRLPHATPASYVRIALNARRVLHAPAAYRYRLFWQREQMV